MQQLPVERVCHSHPWKEQDTVQKSPVEWIHGSTRSHAKSECGEHTRVSEKKQHRRRNLKERTRDHATVTISCNRHFFSELQTGDRLNVLFSSLLETNVDVYEAK